MSLTVSELLALEGLSALRLRAGKQGLQRAVRWYYVAENEHIAEWIMGGELVFITGINHPRDEANLIQLLMEGKQRGIAGMVILTGEAYIHAIPATLIALADELGMPLIEQPYLLKMVIVTERVGTALVRSENALQSQRDILMQLVTGDYPDLQMLHQRALHQQLDFTRPLRLAALRLEGLSRLFRQFPPEQAEAWLLQAHRSVRQQLQQQLNRTVMGSSGGADRDGFTDEAVEQRHTGNRKGSDHKAPERKRHLFSKTAQLVDFADTSRINDRAGTHKEQ